MKFSVIIPTKNRSSIASSTIIRLSSVDYPRSWYEIIAVDNNSSDGSYDRLQRLKRSIKNLTVLKEKQQGASFARNTGIRHAMYGHVVCIDDDMIVPTDFLKRYAEAWREHKNAAIVGGAIRLEYQGKPTPRERAVLDGHRWIFGRLEGGKKDRKLSPGELVYGGNMSFRKTDTSFFSELLGVRSRFGRLVGAEDYEFCTRFLLEGREVWLVPGVRVAHPISLSRCSAWYVLRRFFLTGLDMSIMDALLVSRFGDAHRSLHAQYRATFLESLRERKRTFFLKYCSSVNDIAKLVGYYGATMLCFRNV